MKAAAIRPTTTPAPSRDVPAFDALRLHMVKAGVGATPKARTLQRKVDELEAAAREIRQAIAAMNW